MTEHVKTAVDTGAIGVLIATLFSWLPHATALVTFVWICIRLWETKTVQRLFGRKPRGRDED